MIKLSKNLDIKNRIFNLIMILSLIFSFISYKIYAATSEHLVVEAAQFSSNGEEKIVYEFSSDYIDANGNFANGTSLYKKDLDDNRALLRINHGETVYSCESMGSLFLGTSTDALSEDSEEFRKIAGETGIDKKIWSVHGTNFREAAVTKDASLRQSTYNDYVSDYEDVIVSGRSFSDTDFIAYVPDGDADEFSNLEGEKVTQKLYNEYKIDNSGVSIDPAEKYIISFIGNPDYSPYIQEALWCYRGDIGLADVRQQARKLVEEARNYGSTPENIPDSLLLDVKWKKGTHNGINYDKVNVTYDREQEAYYVGPFALEYDGSITSFKDMATLELYTNMEDLEGYDLKDPSQDKYSLVHCDVNNGTVIEGYDSSCKEFPDTNAPFYIKLNVTEKDKRNMKSGEFLAVSRCISNIKIKLRVPKPKVDVEFLKGTEYSGAFEIKSTEENGGKIYYLEQTDILPTNAAYIWHVKNAEMRYIEKEVNKYLDINIGKLYINSTLYDTNMLDDDYKHIINSNKQLKYKIKVTGNILKENGTPEDYDEEEINVPLTGKVVSRDYAWVGNEKPDFEITVENMDDNFLELIDGTVELIDTKKGVDENGDPLGHEEIDADLDDNAKIVGKLRNGIITLNYNYYASNNNETALKDEKGVYTYGKIAIDNIVKHDESLTDEVFSLEGATQAYILTISAGEDSLFYYDGEAYVYGQEDKDCFQKIIVLNGRKEDDTENVECVKYYDNGKIKNIENANRFISKNIIWPKGQKAPTYTVDRIDEAAGVDEESYVQDYEAKFIAPSPVEKSYFSTNLEHYNALEYGNGTDEGLTPDLWDSKINTLGKNTYIAILDEKETVNTSGTVVSIDWELADRVGNSDRADYLDPGTICVKMVSEHRKDSGEIEFEKLIDLEEDEYFKNLIDTDPEKVTELFDLMKENLEFEFEIGIGTDVETVTLDKNYREPYMRGGKVCGYKWVWKSGTREWLSGNDLYYTIKENLNSESVLFSRIEDPEYVDEMDVYDIHGNIATGSYRNYAKGSKPIRFYGTFIYEDCYIDINENLTSEGSSMSPIREFNPEEDNNYNARKMLEDSNLFFNIEVNGIFVYELPGSGNVKAKETMDNNNYRILNGNKEIVDSSGNPKFKGYIDLNDGDLTSSCLEEEFVLSLEGKTESTFKQSIISSKDIPNQEEGIGRFIWIRGMPPKYIVEQDTKKIIENEVAKNGDETSENKNIDTLKNMVSWQTYGTKEGVLSSIVNENYDINNTHHMRFEFTNDIPSIERNMKTGRLFLKQYVHGSDDYLKEVQKNYEFTFKVEVNTNKWNDPDKTSRDSNAINLLTIDELVIKAEVADDGNYVWEWTSPDITWDDDYVDTPMYTITLDESKLPAGMTYDFAEKVNRDISKRLGHETGEKKNSVVSLNKIVGSLSESGKNENEDRYNNTLTEKKPYLDIDDRLETTDVYFYASKGIANRSKIKLIQSFDSKEAYENSDGTKPITICITSNSDFSYNNRPYEAGKKYYLTNDKDLADSKSDKTSIMLDVDKNDLVGSYVSNYFIWGDPESGSAPMFWIEDVDTDDNCRNVFPCPKKEENAYSIASPIGIYTITDSYFEKSQSKKAKIKINVKDVIKINQRRAYDTILPREYKESLDIYFKVHVENRGDTYLKATFVPGATEDDDMWEYKDDDGIIKFGNDTTNYTVTVVSTNQKLSVRPKTIVGETAKTLENGLVDGENLVEFYFDDESTTTVGKAKFHIVALRSNASSDETFECTLYRRNLVIKNKGADNGSNKITQEMTFEQGKYSVEYYTNTFIVENQMAPFEVVASGTIGGKQYPNYWTTNIGQGIDGDSHELINVVIDYTERNKIDDSNELDRGRKGQYASIVVRRTMDSSDADAEYIKHFVDKGNKNMQKRPCMVANVYVQGYGTKKLTLYGEGIKDAMGSINESVDITQGEWTWSSKTFKHDSNWAFESSESFCYTLDNADFLNYRIIDFELPNGYRYSLEMDPTYENNMTKDGIMCIGNGYAFDKEIGIKYDRSAFPISRVLAVKNMYSDEDLEGDTEYKAEVSGTYQYILDGEIHRVVNSTVTFTAKAEKNGIYAFTYNNGTVANFVWDYASKPPRYSITKRRSSTTDNMSLENAAGYMDESAITYAIARNEFKKVGGYICILDKFYDTNNNEYKSRPNKSKEFIVSVYKYKEYEGYKLISSFVDTTTNGMDDNKWVSPRISWYDTGSDEIYYKITPINCKVYTNDYELELASGVLSNTEDPDTDVYSEYGDTYIKLKEHDYDDINAGNIEFTTIKYKLDLLSATITFKNARIWVQNPDNTSDLNQDFKVQLKLSGDYWSDDLNRPYRAKDPQSEIIKSQSSDSENNYNESDSVKQKKIKYYPDDDLIISVDENVEEGNNNHADKWKNINISNSNNYLVGDTTIYLTNQYNEFKDIDLTISAGGEVTVTNGMQDKDIEVYAKIVTMDDEENPEESEDTDNSEETDDEEDIGGSLSRTSDELAMVNRFGIVQSLPVYAGKDSGKWEMTGILIPQFYGANYEFYYRYDGQKYKAVDTMTQEETEEYMNNPNSRESMKTSCKVAESNYERKKFDRKFESISGKIPEDVDRKSISTIFGGGTSREIGYLGTDGRGESDTAFSELDTVKDNLVRSRFAMTASTMVIADNLLEAFENEEIDEIDYSNPDCYVHYLQYPPDERISRDGDVTINIQGVGNKKFISSKFLKDINIKLEIREDVSLSVKNELLNVRSVVNGEEDLLYENGNTELIDGEYKLGVNSTDYFYRADIYKQNDGYGYLKNLYNNNHVELENSEMEIYLTYKYTVSNDTESYTIKIDEIENYISDSIEIVGGPKENAEGEIEWRPKDRVYYTPSNHSLMTGGVSYAGAEYLKYNYETESNPHFDDYEYSVIPGVKSSYEHTFDKMSLIFDDGIYIRPSEEHNILVDFKVKKKTIDGVARSLDIGNEIKNIIEVGKYSTFYDDEFDEDDIENSMIAGKVSNRFAPDNLNLGQAYSLDRYEIDSSESDPSKKAKLSILLDYDGTGKYGKVVERDIKGNRDDANIGGMTVQMLERMYVSTSESTEPDRGYDFLWSTDRPLSVYGGKSMYEVQLNGEKKSIQGEISALRHKSTTETNLDSAYGEFEFNNIPNGKFVLRVVYGLDKSMLDNTCGTSGDPVALDNEGNYYAKKTNGGEVLTANFEGDKTGTTAAVYNGQDFKSYPEEMVTDGNKYAKYGDDEARRIETMACDMTFKNENTRVFAKLNDKAGVHQRVYDNYYMYLMSNNLFDRGDNSGIDEENKETFAIMERPENEIYIDQQIESIKIITNDNKVIFDAEYDIAYDKRTYEHPFEEGRKDNYKYNYPEGKAYAVKDLNGTEGIFALISLNREKSAAVDMLQQIYKDENKLTVDREKYSTGTMNFKFVNIDNTILQGTTIEINYRISAINVGDEDYIGSEIESMNLVTNDGLLVAKGTQDFGNYNNQILLRKMAINLRKEISEYLSRNIEEPIEFGKKVGKYYYTLDKSNQNQVRTRVRQVLNYVDNDAVFMTEKNNEDNKYWRASTAAELNGYGLDRNRLVESGQIDIYKVLDKNEMAYMTRERNNIALSVDEVEGNEGIKNDQFEGITVPYEYYTSLNEDEREKVKWNTHINIVTTKTVSSTSDANNMSYETLSEIVKYENTAGRRDETMHIGNANPRKGEFETSLKERDSSSTEIVTFMPPTGLDKLEKGKRNIVIVLGIIVVISSLSISIMVLRKKFSKMEEN